MIVISRDRERRTHTHTHRESETENDCHMSNDPPCSIRTRLVESPHCRGNRWQSSRVEKWTTGPRKSDTEKEQTRS